MINKIYNSVNIERSLVIFTRRKSIIFRLEPWPKIIVLGFIYTKKGGILVAAFLNIGFTRFFAFSRFFYPITPY